MRPTFPHRFRPAQAERVRIAALRLRRFKCAGPVGKEEWLRSLGQGLGFSELVVSRSWKAHCTRDPAGLDLPGGEVGATPWQCGSCPVVKWELPGGEVGAARW